MKIKKKEQLLYNDSWLYILLLITAVLLTSSLQNFTLSIYGAILSYSIFLLPLQYFIVNYITKKYGYRLSVVAICFSSVAMVIFNILTSAIIGSSVNLINIASIFSGYIVSHFINLTIYYFLLQNTSLPSTLVFLNGVFSLIAFYMIYTLININNIYLVNYWSNYFVTIAIQSIICLILTIFEKLIKRGRIKIKKN